MTIDEKRNVMYDYCWETSCDKCSLKGKEWSQSLNGECINIEVSPEEDLDRALSLIYSDNSDNVNHPSHYNSGKFEVIDIIEDQKLNFCLGNAVKYICRAGKKDKSKEVEDLKKAVWYIERQISTLEKD